MSFFSNSRSGRFIAAAALAGTMALAAPSFGQAGMGGLAQLSQHHYLHRDMVIFAQELNLDESQRIIIDSLYEDYRAAFDRGWMGLQEQFGALRDLAQEADQQDPTRILDMIVGPIEKWRRDRDELRFRFEEDVRTLLNNEQREMWPAFHRRMLREKAMHQGRLSGEALNLFHVVRDLRLDEHTSLTIAPVMEQYDVALDYALRMREDALADRDTAQLGSIRAAARGSEAATAATAMVTHTEREVQRRLAVREVNENYIDIVAAALPERFRDDFRSAALERAYPRVYRPMPAQRLLAEAKRISGLDPSTHDAIAAIEAQFLAEMDSFNNVILRELRTHEPEAMLHSARAFAARQAGENVTRLTDPTLEHIRERDSRATAFVEQVRDMLEPEQFAMLPGASRYLTPAQRAARQTPAMGSDTLDVADPSRGRAPRETDDR